MKVNNEEKNPAVSCIVAVLVFVNIVPVMIWRGFVLQSLWVWFLVPLGTPMVGIVQAIGVSMTLSYIAGTSSIQEAISKLSKKTDEDANSPSDLLGKILMSWLGPLFILGMAKALTHWL